MSMKNEGLTAFIDLCQQCQDTKSLTALFDMFLTEEEKSDIALRCLLIQELLKQELPQREIAKKLNISIAKVTRGSNELKRINNKLLKFLQNKLT